MEENRLNEITINPKDLRWKFSRGTGNGGQKRNKTSSCVDLLHTPTGITVRIDGRSQNRNKNEALSILKDRLIKLKKEFVCNKIDNIRKEQIGVCERSNKTRTIRVKDDLVIDHNLNKKISYKRYSKGDLSNLR